MQLLVDTVLKLSSKSQVVQKSYTMLPDGIFHHICHGRFVYKSDRKWKDKGKSDGAYKDAWTRYV